MPNVSDNYLVNPTNEREEIIHHHISEIEKYLLGTYPIDMGITGFTGDNSEYDLIKHSKLSLQNYEIFRGMNKLAKSCFSGCVGMGQSVSGFHKYDDITPKLLPFLAERNYFFSPFDKKIDFCRSADRELYALLERLYTNHTKN